MTQLVDTHAAACAVQRSPATIRDWLRKGWLTPHGREDRRTLVDLAQVYEVAKAHAPKPSTTSRTRGYLQ
ncbi:hypothetical protein [Cellulosimicrobium cellulans]|uniref:hypothetical protein n=1 Tax=Cellulosimicrobium cellulans TaxID=1710 RepID=UPI001BA51483|nr:hypothetical protein [Cellulosimicrobium cellulans]QUC01208.1 hypothetical protein J5A69_08620 [Cellulosimicrobium cellulans]